MCKSTETDYLKVTCESASFTNPKDMFQNIRDLHSQHHSLKYLKTKENSKRQERGK